MLLERREFLFDLVADVCPDSVEVAILFWGLLFEVVIDDCFDDVAVSLGDDPGLVPLDGSLVGVLLRLGRADGCGGARVVFVGAGAKLAVCVAVGQVVDI